MYRQIKSSETVSLKGHEYFITLKGIAEMAMYEKNCGISHDEKDKKCNRRIFLMFFQLNL